MRSSTFLVLRMQCLFIGKANSSFIQLYVIKQEIAQPLTRNLSSFLQSWLYCSALLWFCQCNDLSDKIRLKSCLLGDHFLFLFM